MKDEQYMQESTIYQMDTNIYWCSGMRMIKHLMELITLPLQPLVLLLIFQLFQTPATILAQNSTIEDSLGLYDCPAKYANYTSGSRFESNLKDLLFPSLINNISSPERFFNTSFGVSPDTVYGLAQCRPDISTKDCHDCLYQSTVMIVKKCLRKVDATVRFDNCMLRYSNIRFFSSMNTSDLRYTSWHWENENNITDLVGFDQKLAVLFAKLTYTASSLPSKFMTGSIRYNDFSKIYGLVDCTQDLSSADCLFCLQAMLNKLPGCCVGKKGGLVLSRSCEIWYRDFQFFQLLSPPPAPGLLPPLPAPPLPPPQPRITTTVSGSSLPTDIGIDRNEGRLKRSSSSRNIGVIIGPAIAGVAVILLLVVCVYFSRRNRLKKIKYSDTLDGEIRSAESLQFEFVTIRAATNNFSGDNKLGEGGFGEVYKGELLDGQEIAVKRFSKNSGQGLQEFKNEVGLLHKLQHRNLVKLLGFCLEDEEKLLIYEYLPNRSLDCHLFDDNERVNFDWKTRYKIIGGIARGLLYLHEDSRLRIIHRDLKAANILLDGQMNAKIADFGMAKLFGMDQIQGNTSRIGGTFGYIAPEYASHGLFSVKSDAFSFGVLVLEIVSGQRITSFHKSNPQQNLLSYSWEQWQQGKALELMDSTLSDNCVETEVMKSIHIGLLCVQENVENRVAMSAVVTMLNSNFVPMLSPSTPAFYAESKAYSNMMITEQESDLYKKREQESDQSTSNTSKSEHVSGTGFPDTYLR